MVKDNNLVKDRSEAFALRIVNLYRHLTTKAVDKEFVLSKQLLRSGTSIGANIAESEFAISKDDFKAKLYIALKECNESCYWIRLLHKSNYLSDQEFDSLYSDSEELLKLLVSITKSLKSNP